MRDGFIFYNSFFEAVEDLPAEEFKACVYPLLAYALRGEEPQELKGLAKSFFVMAKPQIDANNKRFENGKKGAAYGKLGGRPKKNPTGDINKNPIGDINETPKEKEKEKEKDNAKDKEKEKEKESGGFSSYKKPLKLVFESDSSFEELRQKRLEEIERLKGTV